MKAIALISGGLDSLLAARLIKEQGIEVIGLKFKIPFHLRKNKNSGDYGFEIREVDIGEAFLNMLQSPRYGYGSNMNPCLDCKILMVSNAKKLMQEWDAGFIITGEVLGQRPMSQHRQALYTIARRAGLEGLVVRPLCAKLLLETIPEQKGWISRDRLLNFSGRGRQQQIALARNMGIQEYAQPAGGCLLTDPEFARRLKNLISHRELSLENVELLKTGRHFRISPNAKLIVGRNEEENVLLVNSASGEDYLFMPYNTAGPTALGRGAFVEELLELSCGIVARYCDRNGNNEVDVAYRRVSARQDQVLLAQALSEDKVISLRI